MNLYLLIAAIFGSLLSVTDCSANEFQKLADQFQNETGIFIDCQLRGKNISYCEDAIKNINLLRESSDQFISKFSYFTGIVITETFQEVQSEEGIIKVQATATLEQMTEFFLGIKNDYRVILKTEHIVGAVLGYEIQCVLYSYQNCLGAITHLLTLRIPKRPNITRIWIGYCMRDIDIDGYVQIAVDATTQEIEEFLKKQ